MSKQVGHVIKVEDRPDLAFDFANVGPEHRTCNISGENEHRKVGDLNVGRRWT